MTKPFYFIIGFLILVSCNEQAYKCHCDTTEVLKNDSILNSKSTKEGLPNFLRRFQQRSLKEQFDEAYRLSTIHFSNKYFQVFTLTKTTEGGYFLIQEFLCSQAYANDGKLVNHHLSKLNKTQWNSFKKVIENNCFWTFSLDDPDESNYLDGGEWWIEGFQPDKRNCSHSNYLITLRKLPSSSKQFYNVYNAFMDFVDTNQIHQTK